ncbi:GNAT family N-acetyltransferase [Microvirga thermotolerans]|uniref:GNAT family N-acetyltransferase n=1 Tax=Microvirga thermotolerans TaxID=2651334 RepID=A0A5P9JTA4_9HYPH|nr:GNAT family N-acetyltransferase [Microvirga thermotolerans]QFU15008.1 GNAT family N-acetyltransferase [Microvirga thermotolerans]
MSDLLVSIRHAKPSDAQALSDVFEAAWREAYRGIIPGVALERMLARRSARWWRSTVTRGRPLVVLDMGQGAVGYISYGRCRDRSLPAEGEIDEFYLLPEYQGVGLGRRLFQAVRNDLRDRGMGRVAVWALADNERACRFYEGMGGRRIARVEERIGGIPLAKVAFLFPEGRAH